MPSPQDTRAHVERIARDGYTVLERAIEPALVDELADTLLRLEHELGAVPAGNGFEGHRTVRIYNLLAHQRVFERVPVHPALLPIVEGVIGEGCLISSLSSIAIDPGESAQPIHADDQLIPLDKPHAPTVCNSMWALTDFTEANGATRVIPGSHLADCSPDYGAPYDSIPAEMPRGSVLVWHGSLWHGGGANTTDDRRVGVAMNYCAGWIRQQENQQLGIPRDIAARFSPRLRQLCGYGIYSGLMGHINKHDPAEMLDIAAPEALASERNEMIWHQI
jgi:ectoine hydroxylase-related dioxygenase (phytanoyl-CoA dioxygenase family)